MKLIYGIGINDIKDITKTKDGIKCYQTWRDMLKRCYSTKFQATKPTYIGCTVHPDWLRLSNFKQWFDKFYVDGYDLDKDIIDCNNKVYSKDTCVFIPHSINMLFREKWGGLKYGTADLCRVNSGFTFKLLLCNSKRIRSKIFDETGFVDNTDFIQTYVDYREQYIKQLMKDNSKIKLRTRVIIENRLKNDRDEFNTLKDEGYFTSDEYKLEIKNIINHWLDKNNYKNVWNDLVAGVNLKNKRVIDKQKKFDNIDNFLK